MTWTTLSFAFGSVLTSTKMTQMYDNFASFAAKESSAPVLANGYVVEAILGNSAVAQGKLKTTTASQSVDFSSAQASVTLSGGTYSWWTASADTAIQPVGFGVNNTAAGVIGFAGPTGAANNVYIDERYVQASPPYHRLIYAYALMNTDGTINSFSVALDPIWAYNGPTIITPQWFDRAGRPFRKVITVDGVPLGKVVIDPILFDRYMGGRGVIETIDQELTLDYKDSDKDVIPHPWHLNELGDKTAVLLTLDEVTEQRIQMMIESDVNQGAWIARRWLMNVLQVDNDQVAGPSVPKSMISVRARPKLTRG